MARVDITPVNVPDAGLNLTDQGRTTMGVGAGNGVMVPYDPAVKVVLKHSAGAVYTFKVVTPGEFAAHGLTIPDKTKTVAAAKDWILPLEEIFRQADGKVYIDCDVAGTIVAVSF